jgi:hypothetical protein
VFFITLPSILQLVAHLIIEKPVFGIAILHFLTLSAIVPDCSFLRGESPKIQMIAHRKEIPAEVSPALVAGQV